MKKTNRPFNKTYNTPLELVKLLQSRGLFIRDADLAARYIQNIGYYRLSAYMYPLLCKPKIEHLYKRGASFDQKAQDTSFRLPQCGSCCHGVLT